jgi:hypothetical protein
VYSLSPLSRLIAQTVAEASSVTQSVGPLIAAAGMVLLHFGVNAVNFTVRPGSVGALAKAAIATFETGATQRPHLG